MKPAGWDSKGSEARYDSGVVVGGERRNEGTSEPRVEVVEGGVVGGGSVKLVLKYQMRTVWNLVRRNAGEQEDGRTGTTPSSQDSELACLVDSEPKPSTDLVSPTEHFALLSVSHRLEVWA